MTVGEPDNRFRRAPRPLTGWLWLLCGVGSVLIVAMVMIPLLRALNRWADGEAVDWAGFAAVGAVLFPFIGQLVAQGIQWQRSRENERVATISATGVAPVPFDPSPPSIGPSPDGPRPGDSP